MSFLNNDICPYCNGIMTPYKELVHFCDNHGNIIVLNVGSIVLCTNGFEIFLGRDGTTALNAHRPLKDENGVFLKDNDGNFKFDYFTEPANSLVILPKRIDVTPDNFDYWFERLHNLVIFS